MALQNVPGSRLAWPLDFTSEIIPSYTILDSDGEKTGAVFQIPETGSLTKVLIPIRSVTTQDADMSFRIETVSGTDGTPSGSLIDANAYGSFNSGATQGFVECTLNAAVSVTKGDVVAFVVALTGACNVTIGDRIAYHYTTFPYVLAYTTGSWAKMYYQPTYALYIDGAWYSSSPGSVIGLQGTTENFAQAAGVNKERGILINLPFKARLVGVKACIAAGATEDYKFMLYSTPTGSPSAVLTGGDVDAAMRYNTTTAYSITYLFPSSYELAINTDYVLCVQVTTTGSIDLSIMSFSDTYASLSFGGSNYYMYGRDALGTTSFTATATKLPQMCALIDQLDDGAGTGGGGGLPIVGGSLVR